MKVDRLEQDEARRERIARAAFELFARSGLEGTSARDIARAAYVSRTNLYRYFPSKTHMLLAHFERTVAETRAEAIRKLSLGAAPLAVWSQVTGRMADLGVRYRHLVGAVGYAVLGAGRNLHHLDPEAQERQRQDLRTAFTLIAMVEPLLVAMQRQGTLRPNVDTHFLATLLVDACLLALLHGEHRSQREVQTDWQDRFSLLLGGALSDSGELKGGESPPGESPPLLHS